MTDWRRTRDYRKWRAEVIHRDKRCRVCDSIKSRNAHHINHATYFSGLRFDFANGACLCRDCHVQFHCNFKNSYKEKCTEKDYNNFMYLIELYAGRGDSHALMRRKP